MKIGYPCINRTLDCQGNKTFRLRSYSKLLLRKTIENNLDCLEKTIASNIKNSILFFRISSDIIPFASHPVCNLDYKRLFARNFKAIGRIVREAKVRISMHPDQFTLLNCKDKDILRRSIAELSYHQDVLEAMQLDNTAKIQLHVGGVYADKKASIKRFIERYSALNEKLRKKIVIENDERSYNVADCLFISEKTGVPVLFDVFHHSINPCRITLKKILGAVSKTWKKDDGIPMVDYSSQKKNSRCGSHALSLDAADFKRFLKASMPFDFDVMLEIKDKEKSAKKAIRLAGNDKRFSLWKSAFCVAE